MYEQIINILLQTFSYAISIFANKLVPLVEGGGSAEASGIVPTSTVVIALIVLAALGIVFGSALAVVAARFVVKVDPKVEKVREALPGANCGACSFAGCMGYAEAVVANPEVAVNRCAPGKSAVAEKIAEITGKKAEKVEPKIARVFCQGGTSLSQRKFIYSGVKDCTAAVLAAGGDKSCEFGCLGYGICMRTCPVDAVKVENNFARIDHGKCIVCGLCTKKCPTNAIRDYIPVRPKAFIAPAKCAGIDICEKVCPVNAISGQVKSVHTVDQSKCIGCGMCASRCPKKAIDMIQTAVPAAGKQKQHKVQEPVSA